MHPLTLIRLPPTEPPTAASAVAANSQSLPTVISFA
jgi:hypothetical protein